MQCIELVHFRKRVGEKGIELILAESIRVNDGKSDKEHHDTAFIDSTVQEKDVTYPTDAKLHKKIVSKVLKIVKKLNLPIRQSYRFVLKGIHRDQRFRHHLKNRKKSIKAGKRLRTIAGRPVREPERNLGGNRKYDAVQRMTGKSLKRLSRDRGCRGKKEINGTKYRSLLYPKPKKHTTNARRNINCFTSVQE